MINFIADTVQVHIAAYFEEFSVYKFLLLRRSMKIAVYPGIWQVITGKIEAEETALEAALRETQEEIAVAPLRMWTIPYITHYFNPKSNNIQMSPVFGILINANNSILLSDEHEKFEWLHLDSALERLVLPSHREAAKIFNEFILAASDQTLFEVKLS